ncbi:MAG: cytochrome c maturation protein CcmE [Anaerolineae bacterium]|nr:cytochrome c maturation protein CcmE [Anaerolineae bacterium]
MAPAPWEKAPTSAVSTPARPGRSGRWKFMAGGLLILGAVAFLVLSGTMSGARYFITVDELLANPAKYAGQTVRVSGAVDGATIQYDPEALLITFTVANVPDQTPDLALALHEAVQDPNANRLQIRVENQVKPELLQHEAQALMTGTLGPEGTFHVRELNLKCPTRFTESGPDQSIAQPAEGA